MSTKHLQHKQHCDADYQHPNQILRRHARPLQRPYNDALLQNYHRVFELVAVDVVAVIFVSLRIKLQQLFACKE